MKTVIEMAREAGLVGGPVYARGLERFAELVRADEREACAKVCENMTLEWEDQPSIAQAELATMMDCALAIRARGSNT